MVGPNGPLVQKALGLPWACLAKGSPPLMLYSLYNEVALRQVGHTYSDACHNITQMHSPSILFLILSSAMQGDSYSVWLGVDSNILALCARILCGNLPGPHNKWETLSNVKALASKEQVYGCFALAWIQPSKNSCVKHHHIFHDVKW